MTDRIDVLVDARNNTSGAFNQIRQELQGLDSVASQLNRGLSGIGAIAGAGAIVAGLQQIGAAIDEIARRGAVFEQLDSVLDSYAESVNQVGDAFVSAGRKASAGTIADYELVLNANRALQFEVAKTSDQYAKLIELATALGRAQGISDTQALEYLTTGIARESRLILDNLGLIIDLDDATKKYADSLGKKSNELTTSERKQALLNAAFEQGQTAIAANRAAADSAATSFERFDASVVNLKDNMGKLVAIASADTVSALATGVGRLAEQMEGGRSRETILAQIEEAKKARDDFAKAGPPLGDFGIPDYTGYIRQMEVLKQRVSDLYAELLKLAKEQSIYNDVNNQTQDGMLSSSSAALSFHQSAYAAALETEHLTAASLDGKDGLSQLEAQAWSTGASLDEVAAAAVRAQAVGNRLGTIRQSAINQAQNLALRAVQAGADPAQVTAMYGEIVDKLSNVALSWDNTNEATLENKLALEGVKSEYDGILESIIASDKEAGRAAKQGVKEMEKAAREAERAFDDLKGKVAGVLQEALDPGVGVDVNTLLKDGVKVAEGKQPNPEDFLLPRADAINENARRLADIAVKGFESPWLEYFKTAWPDLYNEMFADAQSNDSVRKTAAMLLQNFEDGLNPEFIDKERAKDRIKRMLLGETRMEELATQIAAELSAEFGNSISLGKIQATANSALGVDGGNQVQLAQSLTGIATEAGGQAAVIGSNIRAGIVSALDGIGETVAMALDKQLRAENNLKITNEAGRAHGEAWGSGFLATVRDGVPSALVEILASLVGPQLEAVQARNATLNGAN